MLKNISKLGTALNKTELKSINGSRGKYCTREQSNNGCIDVFSQRVCLCPF
ncbi:hypothetical protein [Tenacibaculum halocynthiae]|uniref:hypothetical protein n=1 Tax=Tenacibaculum halocynthiae TaxID=1254437 RepID=UPI00089B704D|nr:hypothetical protein [uncultured Tenacibaculum sp.]SEE67371.1 hypothetical protein SAMN04487765_3735 [Tenacibaculum sp. MAR_2010_89]